MKWMFITTQMLTRMVRSVETQTSPYIASIIVVQYTRTSWRSWFPLHADLREIMILKNWAWFALYVGNSCQYWTWLSFYNNQASCFFLSKSVENFLRYVVLKFSFGRDLRSIRAILVNIELDLTFIITKLPAKFHWNRSITFWVILITEWKNERQTHKSKKIPLPKYSYGRGNGDLF